MTTGRDRLPYAHHDTSLIPTLCSHNHIEQTLQPAPLPRNQTSNLNNTPTCTPRRTNRKSFFFIEGRDRAAGTREQYSRRHGNTLLVLYRCRAVCSTGEGFGGTFWRDNEVDAMRSGHMVVSRVLIASDLAWLYYSGVSAPTCIPFAILRCPSLPLVVHLQLPYLNWAVDREVPGCYRIYRK